MKTLSHAEARRVYDRIGAGQDTQAFYEDAATDDLIHHGEFGSAGAVFEFGCGTGRFAQKLLREHLGPTACYRGVDVSPKMIALATQRLAHAGARAEVKLAEGGCRPVDLRALIAEGPWKLLHHRALAPFGLPSEVVIAERP